jgi:hypothetical protein
LSLTSKLFIYDAMTKERKITQFIYILLIIIFNIMNHSISFAQHNTSIKLIDMASSSGIDFIHYAPRPRW